MGDIDIGSYINSLLATQGVFVPQEIHYSFKYLHQVSDLNKTVFKLPDSICDDLKGIMNAITCLSHWIIPIYFLKFDLIYYISNSPNQAYI